MNAKNKVFDSVANLKRVSTEIAAAYVINEQGERHQITEAMIRNACAELKARCYLPKKHLPKK